MHLSAHCLFSHFYINVNVFTIFRDPVREFTSTLIIWAMIATVEKVTNLLVNIIVSFYMFF